MTALTSNTKMRAGEVIPAAAGVCERAPYRKEHQFAENIEKLVARELEVDWPQYNRAVERL